jgi:hypothetical protein
MYNVEAFPELLPLMVEAWLDFFSIPFCPGQGVRHRLSEGAGKFGAEVAGFAQDHLGGTHAESAGRFRPCE